MNAHYYISISRILKYLLKSACAFFALKEAIFTFTSLLVCKYWFGIGILVCKLVHVHNLFYMRTLFYKDILRSF